MSHLLLSVMGAFAQFERDLIRERQREGIALANCAKAHTSGESIRSHQRRQRNCGDVSLLGVETALASELGISRQTLYRYAAGAGK